MRGAAADGKGMPCGCGKRRLHLEISSHGFCEGAVKKGPPARKLWPDRIAVKNLRERYVSLSLNLIL